MSGTGPYSDTKSPSANLPPEWQELERLSTRLGLVRTHAQDWGKLKLAAIHNILDRLDVLEREGKEINRG